MTRHKKLLGNLLQALVDEWGHGEVEATLKSLNAVRAKESHRRQRAMRRMAIDQVAKLQFREHQTPILHELAARFDSKQFLPSMADVREFLIMSDQIPSDVKDRADAFRKVLIVLTTLPPERLERLANSALHSGPTRLGPLSDAIGDVANSLPRNIRLEKEAA